MLLLCEMEMTSPVTPTSRGLLTVAVHIQLVSRIARPQILRNRYIYTVPYRKPVNCVVYKHHPQETLVFESAQHIAT